MSVIHGRLAHQSEKAVRGAISAYEIDVHGKHSSSLTTPCEHCQAGKGRRKQIGTSSTSDAMVAASAVLDRVHFDIHGPMSIVIDGQRYQLPTLGGAKYFLVCVDEYSRYSWLYLLREKSEASQCVIDLLSLLSTQLKENVRSIHSDGGGEFTGETVKRYCQQRGIVQTFTTTSSPAHNGICERMIGILLEMMRAMLSESGAPHELWGEAIVHAAFVRNRTPLPSRNFNIPAQVLTGKRPDVSKLRVFGCDAFVHVLDAKRGDTQSRCVKGLYIGVSAQQNALRVMVPSEGKIVVSRDVKTNESSFEQAISLASDANAYRIELIHRVRAMDRIGYGSHVFGTWGELSGDDGDEAVYIPAGKMNAECPDDSVPNRASYQVSSERVALPVSTASVASVNGGTGHGTSSTREHGVANNGATGAAVNGHMADGSSESSLSEDAFPLYSIAEEEFKYDEGPIDLFGGGYSDEESLVVPRPDRAIGSGELEVPASEFAFPEDPSVPVFMPEHVAPTTTRAGRVSKQSERSYAFDENDFALVMAFIAGPGEPESYAAAIKDANRPEWQKAMDSEMESLHGHNAWVLVQRTSDMKVIRGKWVFKIKYNSEGVPVRFKARFVCKGFQQLYGIDYFDTYAPVAKLKSMKLLFKLAVTLGLELNQIDFDTAFLNAEVSETIYVEQPEGYVNGTNMVCKLNKALYGLKQAPKCWYDEVSGAMKKLGYRQCMCDPCVYVKTVAASGEQCYIVAAIYVDDFVIALHPNSKSEWARDMASLAKRYPLKDMGECGWVLNMRVIRDRTAGTITLDQSTHVGRLIDELGITALKPCDNVATHKELVLPPDGVAHLFEQGSAKHRAYQSLVGSLLYIANCTRVDIAYVVGVLARQMSAPAQHHMTAAVTVLRYLTKTKQLGMVFRRDSGGITKLDSYVGTSFPLEAYSDADWAGDKKTMRSTTGVLVRVGGDVISWVSKRQDSVALSTAEAEYIALSAAVKEVQWYRHWLTEVIGTTTALVPVYCDNMAAVAIATNYGGSHKVSKHIAMRYNHVQDELHAGTIDLKWVPTTEQLADVLTKVLPTKLYGEVIPQLLVATKGSV